MSVYLRNPSGGCCPRLAIVLVGAMLSVIAGGAQPQPAVPLPPASGTASEVLAKTITLTVEVVGGTPSQPISGARIFLRTEAGALLVESRTNIHGVAVIQDVPIANVKLQITATTDWAPQGVVVNVGRLKTPPTVRFVLIANTAAEPTR